MKIKSFFNLAFLSALIMCATSCSSDDDNRDPDGTIPINMMNERNGETTLGYSDVYIDDANNFNTYNYWIAPLGKRSGLGSLPAPTLKGLASEVAVESGNAYQIFHKSDIRKFPSGKFALDITEEYYNVYVVSEIKQEGEIIGSAVKFKLEGAPRNGLPEYDSCIGTLSLSDFYNNGEATMEFELPTSDFEYEPRYNYDQFEYEKKGKKLIIKLVEQMDPYNFGLYIRIQGSYTCVYWRVDYE